MVIFAFKLWFLQFLNMLCNLLRKLRPIFASAFDASWTKRSAWGYLHLVAFVYVTFTFENHRVLLIHLLRRVEIE